MKKIYIMTLITIILLSSNFVNATGQITLPQSDSAVVRNILRSETNIDIVSGESDSSISGEAVNDVINSENNKSSDSNFFGTVVEIGILVYLISKTFQYISESGKTFSESTNEKIKYYKELPFDDITPGQAEFLKEHGCSDMQGFYLTFLLQLY